MHCSYFSKRRSPRSLSSVLTLAVVVAVVIGLMLVALGCGDKPGLVGKWALGGDVWEFTSEGTVLGISDVPAGVEVTYVVEGDVLTISALGQEVLSAKFSVEGDTLELINPEDPSEVETARRVK
jgi:hypothetical protein